MGRGPSPPPPSMGFPEGGGCLDSQNRVLRKASHRVGWLGPLTVVAVAVSWPFHLGLRDRVEGDQGADAARAGLLPRGQRHRRRVPAPLLTYGNICGAGRTPGNQEKTLPPRTRKSSIFGDPSGPFLPQCPPEEMGASPPAFSCRFWGEEGPFGPPKPGPKLIPQITFCRVG